MTLARLALAPLLILAACTAVEQDVDVETVSSGLALYNGSNLNGSNLNGSNLNGSNLNGSDPGATLASVSLSGVVVEGKALDAAWLDGSMLAGARAGRQYVGTELDGAELVGAAGTGAAVALRIESALAPSLSTGYWRYFVSHQRADGTWAPVCTNGAPAVAVFGRWDYRRGVPGGGAKISDPGVFTFGCEGAAIEKCVRAGYQPWATVNGVQLDAHHQACVRLIRADFCGNGLSHTTEGRWINLYDAVGIQSDDRSWLMEAEWTPHGARCVALLSRSLLGALCNDSLYTLSCGLRSHFSSGTLLMSETPSGILNTPLF